MKLLAFFRQHKRTVVYAIAIISLSLLAGAYVGVTYCKKMIHANAFALWARGMESFHDGQYDQAMFYYTQAVALKNDEPVFVLSVAETYEAKKDVATAIVFYEAAVEKYKELKMEGKIKSIEKRIEKLRIPKGVSP